MKLTKRDYGKGAAGLLLALLLLWAAKIGLEKVHNWMYDGVQPETLSTGSGAKPGTFSDAWSSGSTNSMLGDTRSPEELQAARESEKFWKHQDYVFKHRYPNKMGVKDPDPDPIAFATPTTFAPRELSSDPGVVTQQQSVEDLTKDVDPGDIISHYPPYWYPPYYIGGGGGIVYVNCVNGKDPHGHPCSTNTPPPPNVVPPTDVPPGDPEICIPGDDHPPVVASVPEPSSITLLLGGLVAVVISRKLNKRA